MATPSHKVRPTNGPPLCSCYMNGFNLFKFVLYVLGGVGPGLSPDPRSIALPYDHMCARFFIWRAGFKTYGLCAVIKMARFLMVATVMLCYHGYV
jgi:hypothetical protein